MFGVITCGSLLFTGFLQSFNWYAEKGYGSHYYVTLNQMIDYEAINNKANELQKQKLDALRAEAKRKGQPFDEASASNTAYQLANEEANRLLAKPTTPDDIKKAITGYEGSKYYVTRQPNGVSFALVLDGKEQERPKQDSINVNPFSGSPIASLSMEANDTTLMEPFVLEGNSLAADGDKVPILIPMDIALSLKKVTIDKKATTSSIVATKQKVRNELIGKDLQVCFRNTAADALLSTAQEQKSEFEKNKDNKDYKKPLLQYTIPTEACKSVIVTDNRAQEEKDADARAKKEANEADPKTDLVTFKIVGFTPASPDYSSGSGLLAGIFTTGPVSQTLIPLGIAEKHPVLKEYYSDNAKKDGTTTTQKSFGGSSITTLDAASDGFIIDFPNRETQKRFIENQCGGNDMFDPSTCIKSGKLFSATAYGNPRVALEDFKSGFMKAAKIVITIIFVISSILMMGMISKVIADSRRETGVFRAIGAKRFDIAQIYLSYSVLLATAAFVLSGIIASLGALYIARHFADRLTVEASDVFAVYENVHKIFLFGIDILQLLQIYAVAVLAGLVGGFIPITGNIRRNPIKDMRDE
jgi:hypothetical protein